MIIKRQFRADQEIDDRQGKKLDIVPVRGQPLRNTHTHKDLLQEIGLDIWQERDLFQQSMQDCLHF